MVVAERTIKGIISFGFHNCDPVDLAGMICPIRRITASAPAEATASSTIRSAINFDRAYPVGDAHVRSGIGASSIRATVCPAVKGQAMAVPTEEQKSILAGLANGLDSDRLMRFCSEASCGAND